MAHNPPSIQAKKVETGHTDEEYREAFKVFDVDGNGKITKEELKNVMHKLGEHRLTMADIEAMIREADQDGDGQIDFNEVSVISRRGC